MVHGHKRHGTTTVLAALNLLTGEVSARNMARPRLQEFLHVLIRIARDTPADKAIHMILDNSCTHRHANVRAWLARHLCRTFHFILTSSS
ncbi:MAG: transposase [Rhodobacter sp.]|nr:transposase [Rhodobacter sp.]